MSEPEYDAEKIAEEYRNDPRSTAKLIAAACATDPANRDFWDFPGYKEIVAALQHRLDAIFSEIAEMAVSEDEMQRGLAATVLGQNLVAGKWQTEKCCDELLPMLRCECSDEVVESVLYALGHLKDPRAIEAALPFKDSANSDIRFALVHTISVSEDVRAIAGLIELSADENFDVRNWATFGIGSLIDADTPEIREALTARLQEPDNELRHEAIMGLVRRGDLGVADLVWNELNSASPISDISSPMFEDWVHFLWSIGEIADEVAQQVNESDDREKNRKWLRVLEKYRALKIGEAADIAKAIARCEATQ